MNLSIPAALRDRTGLLCLGVGGVGAPPVRPVRRLPPQRPARRLDPGLIPRCPRVNGARRYIVEPLPRRHVFHECGIYAPLASQARSAVPPVLPESTPPRRATAGAREDWRSHLLHPPYPLLVPRRRQRAAVHEQAVVIVALPNPREPLHYEQGEYHADREPDRGGNRGEINEAHR